MGGMHWKPEVVEKVNRLTGLRLSWLGDSPRALMINRVYHYGEGLKGYNELIGPLHDPDNRDVRIFINHRYYDGETTCSLVVQDRTDDCFLNSTAEGTEKYQHGILYPDRLPKT